MNGQYKYGYIEGGTVRNVEVGFHPSKVRITNLSAKDEIFEATLDVVIPFDSMSPAILAGYRVRASDGGWDGIVGQVVKTASATGFLIMVPGMTGAGNIANNDGILATEYVDEVPTVNHADTTAANLPTSWSITSTVAAAVGISAYDGGSGEKSVGFSVTTGPGSVNELMLWEAWTANCDGE